MSETKRVLCIDDRPRYGSRLARAAEHAGHQFVMADTTITALLMAQSNSFDLLLLNIHFKDEEGFRLCGKVRHLCRGTPVVAFSYSESDWAKALEAGADRFVTLGDTSPDKPHVRPAGPLPRASHEWLLSSGLVQMIIDRPAPPRGGTAEMVPADPASLSPSPLAP